MKFIPHQVAAASVITVTNTATTVCDLMDTAGSVSNSLAYSTDQSINGVGIGSGLLITPEDGIVRLGYGITPTAALGTYLQQGKTYFFPNINLADVKLIRNGGADVSCSVDILVTYPAESFGNVGIEVADATAEEQGLLVTKTLTCNGNGAQADNIFSVTGSVKIIQITGECTEATNSTTLSGASFALNDGTATVEITDGNAPTDLSGIGVGGVVFRNGVSASVAVGYNDNAAGAVKDLVSEDIPFIVTKKTGAATYIQFLFTGDVNTDVDMKFSVRYLPISDDGAITSV